MAYYFQLNAFFNNASPHPLFVMSLGFCSYKKLRVIIEVDSRHCVNLQIHRLVGDSNNKCVEGR